MRKIINCIIEGIISAICGIYVFLLIVRSKESEVESLTDEALRRNRAEHFSSNIH